MEYNVIGYSILNKNCCHCGILLRYFFNLFILSKLLKMNKLLTTLALSFATFVVNAQSYSGPESVEFDYANDRYFISNTNSGQILARSSTGTLTIFASGISSGPHGLEILGNVLYACDGGSLLGYDLTTGTQILNVSMGATFLNGITNNGTDIFITDFSTKKVYRYDVSAGTYTIFVTGLVKTPNGIIYDQPLNRLVMVSWGSNAPIMGINMTDSTVSQLAPTTLGNCDGIAMDCQGRFYVASWSPNRISRFANDFSGGATNMNATGLSSPADIVFNTDTDTLGVPNSGNNTVTFYNYSSCLSTGIEQTYLPAEIFQSSSRESGTISIFLFSPGEDISYSVTTIAGSQVASGKLTGGNQMIRINSPGIYFVEVRDGNRFEIQKVFVR